jgi:ABC-type branched-subunit amino acid transport system substrate-binding protein
MRNKVMAEHKHGLQARPSILGAGAAALFAFSLAACEIVPSGGPAPLPPEPEVARPEPQPPRPDVEAEPTLPAGEARHRVAVLVPLTGPNAGVGTSIANAANLALLDLGGERIRITVYDTGKGAQAAANQALADGSRLFLGPLLAEDVRAVAPLARRADVPVVSFSNDVSVAGGGVYLMGFTPGQSVSRVVAYARSSGAALFGAIAAEGVYGSRASEAMVGAVARAGGELTGIETFERGLLGIRTAVGRLAGHGSADAVLIADSGRGAATAAPIIKASALGSARILGTELWATDTDLGKTAALRGAWYAGPPETLFNQLRTRYRARYGANPYRLASLGYDAVLLTVRVAKDWRIGRSFPEGELRARKGFTGVDGAFRFGSDGIAERSLEVREVTAGGTRVISPAGTTFD